MDRPKSLKRLLLSLNNANYNNDTVNIEILVDSKSKYNKICSETKKIVRRFIWKFGEKRIIENTRNVGHINQWFKRPLSNKPFFIFEDDLLLSPDFYLVVKNILHNKFFDGINKKMIGISLGNIRNLLLDDNCKHFEPEQCMKKYEIQENSSYFINQVEAWGPLVFSDIWNKLADFYEDMERKTKKEIHCIPNAWSNQNYNASDTIAQYFMYKYGFFFMYLNTKTEIIHNFKEKGLHFDGKSLSLKYSLFSFKNKHIILTDKYFFDFGFNRINSTSYEIPSEEIINLNYTQKCNIRYRTL